MFFLSRSPGVRRLKPSDEDFLVEVLSRNPEENVYLLGLISDYTVRGLSQMGWGAFYGYFTPDLDGVFYLDATGLIVLSEATAEGIAAFAEYCVRKRLRIARVISRRDYAARFSSLLTLSDPRFRSPKKTFPETAMTLTAGRLAAYSEPLLRPAEPEDAEEVTRGSARAMMEELEVRMVEEDLERLRTAKEELIARGRYFVLKRGKQIVFQAYLSAHLPQVSQVQGVWVAPPFRGQGIATNCVAEMCRRCFDTTRSVVLRVQKRNKSAESVYRKVGFERFQDYLAIWYEDRTTPMRVAF